MICSAHKQPGLLADIIKSLNMVQGSAAYIAVAGSTDALSGTVSFNAINPVISCPPDALPDSPNQSCLANPPGSSNAYIARPENVGRFVAQMYSGVNPKLRQKLILNIADKINKLYDDNKSASNIIYDGTYDGGNENANK